MQNSHIGATSPPRSSRESPDPATDIARIAGLALACGAADAGGSLDPLERTLLQHAARVDGRDVRNVRDAIAGGGDPLGDAFLVARSTEHRRAYGAFYTGKPIRDAMLAWALDLRPERLIDPGCGSGRFAADALRARRQLHVLAVDADPLATLMTRAAIATLGARNARVICGDYLSVSLGRCSGRTAFVGNPPYVRHHELAPALKRDVVALAREAGLHASGLSGLHVWFFVATALRHAANGDIGAFVTSAQWLDAQYGSVVRDLLGGRLGGRSLLTFDATSSPFDAMTTATIATFEMGRAVDRMSFATAAIPEERFDLEGCGVTVDAATLRGSHRWSELSAGEKRSEDGGATIGSTFRVSRGQVTGDNSFFVMTRERARQREIEPFCVPVLSGAREILACDGVVGNDRIRRVALQIPRDFDVASVPALSRYVAEGEYRGVHRGYIASHRTPWYSIEYPRPPIVATYMARRAPRFAFNSGRLGILNALHGLYPHTSMDEESLRAAVARLNAIDAGFSGRGRTYHGGLRKFEPSDLAAVPLR